MRWPVSVEVREFERTFAFLFKLEGVIISQEETNYFPNQTYLKS